MFGRGLILAVLIAKVIAWPGIPSPTCPIVPETSSPFQTFVQHFSLDTVNTGVRLQTRLEEIYANSSVTVTQSYHFNPFKYAAENPDKILLHEREDVEAIKQIVYIPSFRRRDGQGFLAESPTFAGYKLAWGNHEVDAISATWVEGFVQITQWHIIGDKRAAEEIIYEVSAYCATLRDAILVFDQSWWYPDHALWQAVQKASWEDVILDEDFKHHLQADYRSFFKSEQIYKDLEVPWKRGLIFLGPPGNGKTISLKAIMKDAKVPSLYVKSFHTWSGDEAGIKMIFERARAEAPCVLVLEDLDSLITDENRSFFLNEVDGLEDNDGLLLIGTTNHFDRLDPALSSRPSRFDRKYTFTDPKRSERRAYAVYWQNKLKSNTHIKFPDSLLDTIADQTKNFSFAYLKEAFVSTLLTLAGREEEDQGEDFPKVLLDQIKRLREQLDNDELAQMAVESGDGAQAVFGIRLGSSAPRHGGRGSVLRELPGRKGEYKAERQWTKLDVPNISRPIALPA